jgi:hypothetical protein
MHKSLNSLQCDIDDDDCKSLRHRSSSSKKKKQKQDETGSTITSPEKKKKKTKEGTKLPSKCSSKTTGSQDVATTTASPRKRLVVVK